MEGTDDQQDHARQSPARFVRCGFPVLAAGCLILTVIFGMGVHNRHPACYNSDDLTLADFADDLLGGAPVRGWHLPGASYLFPDFVFLLPSRLFFKDLSDSWLAYSFLYYTAAAIALTWIGCLLGLSRRRAWSCACLGICLMLVSSFDIDPASSVRPKEQMRAGTHLGIVIPGLFFLAYVLRGVQRGFRPLGVLTCVLLTGMAVFSDRLLLAEFLVPMCGAVLLVWLAGGVSSRRLLVLLGITFLACLVGAVCKVCLVRMGFRFLEIDYMMEINTPAQVLGHFKAFWNYTSNQTAAWTLVFLFVALTLARLRGARPRIAEGGPATAAVLFTLAGLLCLLGNFVPFFILHEPHVAQLERYGHPLFVMPGLLVLLLWQCHTLGQSSRLANAAVLATLLFVGMKLGAQVQNHGWPVLHQPYPRLAQVLDGLARERGCRHGLAGYWHSRYMRYLTKERVVVSGVYVNGDPLLHGENPDTFLSEDHADLSAPVFRFVVIDREWLTEAAVLKRFGQPGEKLSVPDAGPNGASVEIWLYERIDDSVLKEFVDCLLARRYERLCRPAGSCRVPQLEKPRDAFRPTSPANFVVGLQPETEFRVSYTQAVQADLLDVAANLEAEFEVDFQRNGATVGKVVVPRASRVGPFNEYGPVHMRSRLVPLPESVRNRKWDEAVIRAHGPAPTLIAHFLVFQTEEAASQRR